MMSGKKINNQNNLKELRN